MLAYYYNGHSLTHGLPIWAIAIAVVGIVVRLWLWRRRKSS
jgi:hypothetical protein